MRHIHRKLALTAALALGVVSAQAALHFDIDVIGVELNGSNPAYTGQFDITGPGLGKGYDPVTMTIDSAYATFALWDSLLFGGSETVTVELGTEPFDYSGPFLGLLVLGDDVLGDVLFDLDQDGVLSYTVSSTAGAFKLLGAELHAKSSDRPVSNVPDSGWSLALLGISMAGVATLRRK
jgi:hypothetical protein